MQELNINVNHNRQAFLDAYEHYQDYLKSTEKKTHLPLIVRAVSIIALLCGFIMKMSYLSWIGGVALVLNILFTRGKKKQWTRALAALQDEIKNDTYFEEENVWYCINDDMITSASKDSKSELSWEKISIVVENKDSIYFFTGKRLYLLMVKQVVGIDAFNLALDWAAHKDKLFYIEDLKGQK